MKPVDIVIVLLLAGAVGLIWFSMRRQKKKGGGCGGGCAGCSKACQMRPPEEPAPDSEDPAK